MNDIERKLITIARLALEAVELGVQRTISPIFVSDEDTKPIKSWKLPRRKATTGSTHAGRQYVCNDCGRGFLLHGQPLDATCPSCKSVHVGPRKRRHGNHVP